MDERTRNADPLASSSVFSVFSVAEFFRRRSEAQPLGFLRQPNDRSVLAN